MPVEPSAFAIRVTLTVKGKPIARLDVGITGRDARLSILNAVVLSDGAPALLPGLPSVAPGWRGTDRVKATIIHSVTIALDPKEADHTRRGLDRMLTLLGGVMALDPTG